METEILRNQEERIINEDQLAGWLDTEREGSLGGRMKALLPSGVMDEFSAYCTEQLKGQRVAWNSFYLIAEVSF